MPWQEYVADVALEINPTTGRLQYRTVIITVPRQSGKTTLLLSLMVHRAMNFGTKQNIVYTAQTQLAARKKFEEEHVAALRGSKLSKYFTVRLTNGSEQIKWQNGSRHGITPPTEKAGHGETLDMATLDEAFAAVDGRVEQALRPAMVTRPQPQFYVVSTAGTAKSIYLKDKVDIGRRLVEAEIDGGSICYFEWSAPDDADPGSEDTWWGCMPALGHTISVEAIRADYEDMKLPEFRRAYLNQWSDAIPELWMIVSEQDWNSCKNQESFIPEDEPLVFALDFNPERTFGTISVAGLNDTGQVHIEITRDRFDMLDYRPGTSWIVPRMVELYNRWKPVAVVIQANSPAGSLIPELESKGIKVVSPNASEYAGACGFIFDSIYAHRVVHMGQHPYSIALGGAKKFDLGEGAWKWNRKTVTVDLSPLVSMTLAAWGLNTFGNSKGPSPWASWI